jgi:peptidoglycan L-alanyl-D-glutamate endopeptidase CwlK
MDKITLQRIELLHPKVKAEALEIYKEICTALSKNVQCRFTHTLRTNAEQDALYAQGRTKRGKVITWAKGGESYHNYGLAIDICLLIDLNNDGIKEASWDNIKDFDGDHQSDWKEIVNIFIKYGWEWGGNWNKPKTDTPHFQKTFGKSIIDLKKGVKI